MTILIFFAIFFYRIETEVVAEPQPTVIWTFPSGKSVTEDSRCSIEFDKNEGVATLLIKDIKRSDAGNYKIMVKNSVGLDEMEMRLDVLSAPSIPKGKVLFCIFKVMSGSCHIRRVEIVVALGIFVFF